MRILPLILVCHAYLMTVADAVRLCVTEKNIADCHAMQAEVKGENPSITCVSAADRYDCLHKVRNEDADVMRASPEDVFLARELYDTLLQVVAETRSVDEMKEPYKYLGVGVVRRSQITKIYDLKGSKSCHTGYGRTTGWNIPFSNLLEKGQIQLKCQEKASVVEHDLKAASSYFGLACIPGKWVPDEATDARLKESYNNLCTMCNGQCDSEDAHAGYTGALRCLIDSHGDVAWTKLSAVKDFFKMRSDVSSSDYGLLCPDDRVMDIDDPQPCFWAAKPWEAWLGRAADENKEAIGEALVKLLDSAKTSTEESTPYRPWAKGVLGVESPSVIHSLSRSVTPYMFLNKAKYDTTIERLGCPEEPVKLCISDRTARDKCLAMQQVLKSRRIRPTLECVMPTFPDDCLAMVSSGAAHITAADGGDVFKGHLEYGLIPVVTERYGLLDASYFAVAVVKANSGISSFSQLKGKKSCHTGIDKTAGWKIPVITLLEAGLLTNGNCDYAGELGSFFSSSCAPGAKDPIYDKDGTNPESLCELCVGNDVGGASGPPYSGGNVEGKCERKTIEAFYGYTGAFRCLVQGGGDVAFVKHSTVFDNTNGNNNASWTSGIRSTDFKLLCKSTGTADVVDYNSCNLARVPAHKVVTGVKSDKTMIEEIRILLLRASDKFPKGQDVFNMFGSFRGHHDVIFKDSATDLNNVREDVFHISLEDVYYRAAKEISSCTAKTTGGGSHFASGASSSTPQNGADSVLASPTWTGLISVTFLCFGGIIL